MRSDFLDEIVIDQSHCNHHLVNSLQEKRWAIQFADPGRVSRGGTGSQGKSLQIFEESGLPIPDIVAVRNNCLLIIEIDSTLRKAIESLERYSTAKDFLLQRFSVNQTQELRYLVRGFCRTGQTKDSKRFILASTKVAKDIDLWIVFSLPAKPDYYWMSAICDEI
jgi:hypothetical protein